MSQESTPPNAIEMRMLFVHVEGSTELLLPSAGPPLAHNDDTYKGLYHNTKRFHGPLVSLSVGITWEMLPRWQ